MVLHCKYIVKLESLICEPRACIMSCLINIESPDRDKYLPPERRDTGKLQKGDPEHFGLIRRGVRDIFMFSWGGWRLLGPFLVGAVPFLLAMQTEEIKCI